MRTRLDTAADGATLGLVAWRELSRRAAAQADADCRDVFAGAEYDGFAIALDGRAGEVVATPAQLPHVIQACADEVRIGVADLQRLRFSPVLVDALATARSLQR